MPTGQPTLPCPNCDAELRDADVFCARCGQRVPRGRLTLRDIGGDLWHSVVGVDRSILSLERELLVRPGVVARDWVDGRRKRWFGPFAFLFSIVGLCSVVIVLTDFRSFSGADGGHNDVADFLQRHVNVVQLLQVPLLAAFSLLLFRRSGRNYAEQLVLAAYASGFRTTIFTLLVVPGWFALRPGQGVDTVVMFAYVGLWAAYFGWATVQFHARPTWPTALKGAAAAALLQPVTAWAVNAISRIWLALHPGP